MTTRISYGVRLKSPPRNKGLVDLLLACPTKGWFEPMARLETTDGVEVVDRSC